MIYNSLAVLLPAIDSDGAVLRRSLGFRFEFKDLVRI